MTTPHATGRGPTCLYTDLDNTIIHSADAIRRAGGDPDDGTYTQVDGTPAGYRGYMRTADATELERLRTHGLMLIPVSSRTPGRLLAPTICGPRLEWGVADNGLTIIHDGAPLRDWTDMQHARLARLTMKPADMAETARRVIERHAAGLPAIRAHRYMSDAMFKTNFEGPIAGTGIRETVAAAIGDEYDVSAQGNALLIVPRTVTKAEAAERIHETIHGGASIATGDARTDLPLLEWADHAIIARGGELERQDTPGIARTTHAGADAVGDILAYARGYMPHRQAA